VHNRRIRVTHVKCNEIEEFFGALLGMAAVGHLSGKREVPGSIPGGCKKIRYILMYKFTHHVHISMV
jgi:hypothetical protein